MKYQSRVSIVLALSLLISTLSFPLTADGQTRPSRFRSDTGVITLGVGQKMVVYIGGSRSAVRVRFAWMRYMAAGCNTDGVCRHTIQSQGLTAPVSVAPDETASFEVQGMGNGVRVGLFGDFNGDGAVSAMDIINIATGEVTSHVIMANTEGD